MFLLTPDFFSEPASELSPLWRCHLINNPNRYSSHDAPLRHVKLGFMTTEDYDATSAHTIGGEMDSGVRSFVGSRLWLAWPLTQNPPGLTKWTVNITFYDANEYNNVANLSIDCASMSPKASVVFLTMLVAINGFSFLVVLFKMQLSAFVGAHDGLSRRQLPPCCPLLPAMG